MAGGKRRFKKDLDILADKALQLEYAMRLETHQAEFEKEIVNRQVAPKDVERFLRSLPVFATEYQYWYSEAKAVIKQLLPDRLADFVDQYETAKSRKELTVESYRIEDYLHGLRASKGKKTIAGPEAAISRFQQQVSILKSARARFESSLFDIRELAMADLFDSELEAASELANKKFARAAGALAGVVLEKHLAQVCEKHVITIAKKNPTIGDLNDALKAADIIDLPVWRFIQRLADIRNLCDHNKKVEPTQEQVDDLISGVSKVIKTVL